MSSIEHKENINRNELKLWNSSISSYSSLSKRENNRYNNSKENVFYDDDYEEENKNDKKVIGSISTLTASRNSVNKK